MSIVLGANQYGKAENRVVRIYRDTDRHEIRDLNVSTSLRGDFEDAHTRGRPDQRAADRHPEEHLLRLRQGARRHLARGLRDRPGPALPRCRTAGDRAPRSGSRSTPGTGSRSTARATPTRSSAAAPRPGDLVVTVEGRGDDQRVWVVSGFQDLVVLKSTGSEFKGFLEDGYTTLQETDDRVMATVADRRWRYEGTAPEPATDWDRGVRAASGGSCWPAFATTYSRALQETLYVDGQARPREPTPGGRGQVLRPQQAPLPGRPRPLRPEEQRRGLHRRRPALRPDRGRPVA